MKAEDDHRTDAAELRARAEAAVAKNATPPPHDLAALSPDAARAMLHELQTHQIELEMQNENLRRTEVELEASRARYFDLYDLAPVGYATVDQDGLILEGNLTLATLLNMTRGGLVRQRIRRFILREDQDKFYLLSNRVLETGDIQSCDLRMVKNDGTKFWVQLTQSATKNSDGVPVYSLVVNDITERKHAEHALKLSEKRFRDIIEHAQDWIWEVDADGKYTYVSQTVEAILGYTSEEVLQKPFYDFFHPEDKEWPTEKALAAFAAKLPFRDLLKRNVHKNGQTVWLATNGIPLLDDDGKLIGYRGAATDVTKRKQAEDKTAEQLDELTRWQDVMMDREDRVQELKREVNDLCRRAGEPARYPSQQRDAADRESAVPKS